MTDSARPVSGCVALRQLLRFGFVLRRKTPCAPSMRWRMGAPACTQADGPPHIKARMCACSMACRHTAAGLWRRGHCPTGISMRARWVAGRYCHAYRPAGIHTEMGWPLGHASVPVTGCAGKERPRCTRASAQSYRQTSPHNHAPAYRHTYASRGGSLAEACAPADTHLYRSKEGRAGTTSISPGTVTCSKSMS